MSCASPTTVLRQAAVPIPETAQSPFGLLPQPRNRLSFCWTWFPSFRTFSLQMFPTSYPTKSRAGRVVDASDCAKTIIDIADKEQESLTAETLDALYARNDPAKIFTQLQSVVEILGDKRNNITAKEVQSTTLRHHIH